TSRRQQAGPPAPASDTAPGGAPPPGGNGGGAPPPGGNGPGDDHNDDDDRASNSDNSNSGRDSSAKEFLRRLLEEIGGDDGHSGRSSQGPFRVKVTTDDDGFDTLREKDRLNESIRYHYGGGFSARFNRGDARRRVDQGVFQTTSQDLAPSVNRREALRTSTTHFKGDRGLHSTPFQWRDLSSVPQEIIHEQSRRLTSMWDTWTNKRHGISGPRVHDALAATDFPTLEAESDEAALEWYDKLVTWFDRYNIRLNPADLLDFRLGPHTFMLFGAGFIPSRTMGTVAYTIMSSKLQACRFARVNQVFLSTGSKQIQDFLFELFGGHPTGGIFNLFRRTTTVGLQLPTLDQTGGDLMKLCLEFDIYLRISRIRQSTNLTQLEVLTTFLNSVGTGDSATKYRPYLANINRDLLAHAPPHTPACEVLIDYRRLGFTIQSLTNELLQCVGVRIPMFTSRSSDLGGLHANRAEGSHVRTTDTPWVATVAPPLGTEHLSDEDYWQQPRTDVQRLTANRVASTSDTRGRSTSSRHKMPDPGYFPVRRRERGGAPRNPHYTSQCPICLGIGHEAEECIPLAQGILVERWRKSRNYSEDIVKKVLEHIRRRSRDVLARRTRGKNPAEVRKLLLDETGLDEDAVETGVAWGDFEYAPVDLDATLELASA
ncbi:hypothetical protein THAOC_36494, partial [Thalassiosira oceanica]